MLKVRWAIRLQAFPSTILIFFTRSLPFALSLGNSALIAKLLLLLVGICQCARKSISYYHCVALSFLCQMLTAPGAFAALLHMKFGTHPRADMISLLLILLSSLLHVAFLIFLIPPGLAEGEWCSASDKLIPLAGGSAFRWNPSNPAVLFVQLQVEVGIILAGLEYAVTGRSCLVTEESNDMILGTDDNPEKPTFRGLCKDVGIVLLLWIVPSGQLLDSTVYWLYSLSDGSDGEWGFG